MDRIYRKSLAKFVYDKEILIIDLDDIQKDFKPKFNSSYINDIIVNKIESYVLKIKLCDIEIKQLQNLIDSVNNK